MPFKPRKRRPMPHSNGKVTQSSKIDHVAFTVQRFTKSLNAWVHILDVEAKDEARLEPYKRCEGFRVIKIETRSAPKGAICSSTIIGGDFKKTFRARDNRISGQESVEKPKRSDQKKVVQYETREDGAVIQRSPALFPILPTINMARGK